LAPAGAIFAARADGNLPGFRLPETMKRETFDVAAGAAEPGAVAAPRRERKLIATVLLVVLLAAGCATTRTADPQADYPEERAQVERRLQEVFAAAETKDFDRLDGYHFYGPKFTKFSDSSSQRLDAAAGRKGEHDGLGSVTGMKMRADALKIDVFGNVAVATFILDYSFTAAGAAVRGKERSTLVFVKDGGGWKITHEHLSPIP
jgi:ketosteroid isomerase-like protein